MRKELPSISSLAIMASSTDYFSSLLTLVAGTHPSLENKFTDQKTTETLSTAIIPGNIPVAIQLELQEKLITACKQGDEKEVAKLFKQGAKPRWPNARGEQPLGAAVWGLCPGVIDILLARAHGIPPMSWEECLNHNLRYYQEHFISSGFNPSTYTQWLLFLQKTESNNFIRGCHLKDEAQSHWHDPTQGDYWDDWDSFREVLTHRKDDWDLQMDTMDIIGKRYRADIQKRYEEHASQIQSKIDNRITIVELKKPTLIEEKQQDSSQTTQTKPVTIINYSGFITSYDITVPAKKLTLLKKLGSGGFGEVYEGLLHDRPVAIKRMTDPENPTKSDLLIEAMFMFQMGIESEHVVRLIKVCLEKPYMLVMELMPEGSLNDLLYNNQPIPWESLLKIAIDIACGLRDIHRSGIIHFDIKSANILLNAMRAKIGDFGCADFQPQGQGPSPCKGSLSWLAPERLQPKARGDISGDIYSFGMVLWEMAARGKFPFQYLPTKLQRLDLISRGGQETIPETCPPQVKESIKFCWIPHHCRPSARQVIEKLKLSLADSKGLVSQPFQVESTPAQKDLKYPVPQKTKTPIAQTGQILMPVPKKAVESTMRLVAPFSVQGDQMRLDSFI